MNPYAIAAAEHLPPLSSIYRWGLDAVRAIQGAETPGLTAAMRGVTFLGSAPWIAALLMGVYWCVDARRGGALTLTVLAAVWANLFAKAACGLPRPGDLDAGLALVAESGYGFPSGHAQISLCVYWPLALLVERLARERADRANAVRTGDDNGPAAGPGQPAGPGSPAGPRLAAIAVVLLIGFSRVYLGVHFPTDVLGGWALGAVILAGFAAAAPRIGPRLRGRRAGLLAAAGGALAMLTAGRAPPGTVDPMAAGLFLGFGCGFVLTTRTRDGDRIDASLAPWRRAARALVGAAGTGLVYLAGRALLPGPESVWAAASGPAAALAYYELGAFMRYGLLGLWAAGAPWAFARLGLAGKKAGGGEEAGS